MIPGVGGGVGQGGRGGPGGGRGGSALRGMFYDVPLIV